MFFIVLIFIAISAATVWYFLSRDRGAKEPASALWLAVGFGVMAFAAAATIESVVVPNSFVLGQLPVGLSLVTALLVGIIEETSKFVPLAWFLRGRNYFNEYTDGIIYFSICGLTFGLLENVFYALSFGTGVAVARIVLVPLFHGAITGSVGFFFARAKVMQSSFTISGLALTAAIGLHAVYDFGLSSRLPEMAVVSLMVTVLLTLGLFLFYMRAEERDRALGLSAIGKNRFCRHCGRPNSGHMLYCEFCGQRA